MWKLNVVGRGVERDDVWPVVQKLVDDHAGSHKTDWRAVQNAVSSYTSKDKNDDEEE